MNITEIVKRIKTYGDMMELMPPVNFIDIASYERRCGHKLPAPYVELLKNFNGGEIFIPGTVIYGIRPRDSFYSIEGANADEERNALSIPETYLIIGRLNFGDLICIDFNNTNKVIQWDHENDEEYCSWDSIEDWLIETIKGFEEYNREV